MSMNEQQNKITTSGGAVSSSSPTGSMANSPAGTKSGGSHLLSGFRPNKLGASTTPNILGHKFNSSQDRPVLRTDASKKLTVGKEISLSGEISSCEHLVVEGEVKADVIGAHLVEVTVEGVFNGKIVAEVVSVQGTLKGDVRVTNSLTIRPGGKVSGKIIYNELIIEPGGIIEGTLKHNSEQPENPIEK